MVHFIGAGPGAADLITIRGARFLRESDVVIYAGSLIHPSVLDMAKPGCIRYNSAEMNLDEIITVIRQAESRNQTTARLHSGDPCLYGAIREQTDLLNQLGIAWDDTPGVSSFCGAAAALGLEYTLPGISQSVIITRLPGRTSVPERENTRELARHGASMVIFLSAGMMRQVQTELLESGGYAANTPAAIVYKATWPEERVIRCTIGTLADAGEAASISRTALILIGDFLSDAPNYQNSELYGGKKIKLY